MSDKAVEQEQESNKLFVGNVPFKCDIDEFENVFSNLEGFKNAELIHRGKFNLTRGFGVVEFESENDLNTHYGNEYELKGRILRVTKYQPQEKEKRAYKIFVRGVNDLSEQEIREAFDVHGKINNLELLTKPQSEELSGSVVLEFSEKDSLLKSLKNRTPVVNGATLNVYPFRKAPKNDHRKSALSSVYQRGIRDGKIVGYDNGFKRGYEKGVSESQSN